MKKEMLAVSIEKANGRFYTPDFIVGNILDLSDYKGLNILKKHVMDNSCGDGAFLTAVVDRYCREFFKTSRSLQTLAEELSCYIHGIDIESEACLICKNNLDKAASLYGLKNVDWDIMCADALTVDKYNNKMDFVLGNPPYVRVHNLGNCIDIVKKYSFAQNGMTDLYIVFFEIGLKMLGDKGTLGYITPSSFFNSLAGKYMRSFFVQNNLLDKIVDLKHFMAFDSTTYTAITILKKCREINTTDYYVFDEKSNLPHFSDTLTGKDYYFGGNFYFADKTELQKLKEILSCDKKENFIVKNGFATLADGFFIGDFEFDKYTIPVVKASTGKRNKCIFPYEKGKLISYDDLTTDVCMKKYFETHKMRLLKRCLEKNGVWYGFGRSQGINDVYRCKYAVNAIIKTPLDLKLTKCEKGVGVYGGLYILTEVEESELREILYHSDFIAYISLLGKYKNGGYYTFSSKDLKNYLEYKYSQRNLHKNEQR